MDNWMIGARLAIFIYCVIKYTQSEMQRVPAVLLLLLAYVSISTLSYLFKRALFRRGCRVLSIILLIVSAWTLNSLLILFIPIDVLELAASTIGRWKKWFFVLLLPVCLCAEGIIAEYVIISFLSFLIALPVGMYSARIATQKETMEALREKNESLVKQIDTGNEYEAQVRYLSQMEERNNLAQKIHDKVGHTLAGSIIQLEAAQVVLGRDNDKAAGIICTVTENLKDGMESVRSTLRCIKPPPEQLGINRLKLLLDEFSFNNTMNTVLTFEGSLEIITYRQWKTILENTEEALTNALKYSGATHIHVKLEVLNKLVKMEVKDNGKGALYLKKGMGLLGMEERAENTGGKLIIDGSNGFSVITLLPTGEVKYADKSSNSG